MQLDGFDLDVVVPHFDAGIGMSHQVVVPGRVVVAARRRREHQVPVAVGQVHHRVHPLLAAAGSRAVQQQDWRALELSADPAVVGTEFFDVATVEVLLSLTMPP